MTTYLEELAHWSSQHTEALQRDLAIARDARDRLTRDLDAANERVALLSALLSVGTSPEPVGADSNAQLSLHAAMVKVLESAPERMMRARDLAAEIDRRGLYRMRDGRAVEPQQIHARTGNYPDLFGKEGTFIKLK